MNKTTPEKKIRYTITIGMNDCDTRQQERDCTEIVRIVHTCCKNSGNAYSTRLMKGGYYHEDGQFVMENCMQIALIDPKAETVDKIAEALCCLLHQESVMVCMDEISAYFVLGGGNREERGESCS